MSCLLRLDSSSALRIPTETGFATEVKLIRRFSEKINVKIRDRLRDVVKVAGKPAIRRSDSLAEANNAVEAGVGKRGAAKVNVHAVGIEIALGAGYLAAPRSQLLLTRNKHLVITDHAPALNSGGPKLQAQMGCRRLNFASSYFALPSKINTSSSGRSNRRAMRNASSRDG
jgi:hypothetical protein